MAVVQKIIVPLLAVNDTFLTIVEKCYTDRAAVKKNDILLVLETSKTTYDLIAEEDGFIKYSCEIGQDYAVNDLIAEIYGSESEISNEVASPSINKTSSGIKEIQSLPEIQQVYDGKTLFSNHAKVFIEQNNISPESFAGYDMVTVEDVKFLLITKGNIEKKTEEVTIAKSSKSTTSVLPEGVTAFKITGNKKKEIEYLSAVQESGLTSTLAINISSIGLFGSVNKYFKYFKNSLLPLMIYETARLLNKYPLLNGFYHENQIYNYNNVNIGFAIDIDKGLKVIKIANTNLLPLQELEEQILDLSNKYVEEKIPIEHLTGVSFTITDLSGEGVTYFRPLVNKYNSAILGISSIDTEMQHFNVSITFDHRVTEGKYAAQFLNELKSRIESYAHNLEEITNRDIHCYKCFKTLKEDLAEIGLLPVVTPQGKRSFICQTCLNGL